MNEKLKISCGTRSVEYEEVDLDKYGRMVPTDAGSLVWHRAFDMLQDTMDDITFADDGHRNNDAVNGCIALHVMGYDACAWFENWCAAQSDKRFFRTDLDKFMEHVDRVAPYLSKWGPEGKESEALRYALP